MKIDFKLLLTATFVTIMLSACIAEGNQEESFPTETNQTISSTEANPLVPENLLRLNIDLENRRSVLLTNLLSNDILASFSVTEGSIIHRTFNFNNGYFALLVGYANTTSDGVIEFAENEYLHYIILDESLAVLEVVYLTNEHLQSSFSHPSVQNIYFEDEQLIIYYVVGWVQAYWDEELQSIRRYNVHAGETDILFEVSDESLSINEISRVTDHIFAFTANRIDDELNLHYGFICFESEEMTTFSEPFNLGMITTSSNYVLLTESVDPQNAMQGIFEVTRGEVIILNTETGNQYFIPLDGLESTWARLSLDGQHIVTIDKDSSMFRKYDINSGDLVLEQVINIDGDVLETFTPLTTNTYLIISGNRNSDGGSNETFYREVLTISEVVE